MARSSTGDAPAYRPLAAPWEAALELFRFAGAWAPPPADVVAGSNIDGFDLEMTTTSGERIWVSLSTSTLFYRVLGNTVPQQVHLPLLGQAQGSLPSKPPPAGILLD